jgi:hypothetical protein
MLNVWRPNMPNIRLLLLSSRLKNDGEVIIHQTHVFETRVIKAVVLASFYLEVFFTWEMNQIYIYAFLH